MSKEDARRYLRRLAGQIVNGKPLTIGAAPLREIADMLRSPAAVIKEETQRRGVYNVKK